jgi:hypothetical protein
LGSPLGHLKKKKLAKVELCEGLVEIGVESSKKSEYLITKINIPDSLRRICKQAFSFSLCTPIRLHDGIERIGDWRISIFWLHLHQL